VVLARWRLLTSNALGAAAQLLCRQLWWCLGVCLVFHVMFDCVCSALVFLWHGATAPRRSKYVFGVVKWRCCVVGCFSSRMISLSIQLYWCLIVRRSNELAMRQGGEGGCTSMFDRVVFPGCPRAALNCWVSVCLRSAVYISHLRSHSLRTAAGMWVVEPCSCKQDVSDWVYCLSAGFVRA
jgi:hypothetical protein